MTCSKWQKGSALLLTRKHIRECRKSMLQGPTTSLPKARGDSPRRAKVAALLLYDKVSRARSCQGRLICHVSD